MTEDPEDEEVALLFEWVNCKPDPLPYKPYSPEFKPVNILVEVRIPKKYVILLTKEQQIITPKGMALALRKLKSAIERIQNYGDSDNANGT